MKGVRPVSYTHLDVYKRQILADEPTGALDTYTGHLVMNLFHQLHKEQGKTIVLITHKPELAAETERILTIRDGLIVSDQRKEGDVWI